MQSTGFRQLYRGDRLDLGAPFAQQAPQRRSIGIGWRCRSACRSPLRLGSSASCAAAPGVQREPALLASEIGLPLGLSLPAPRPPLLFLLKRLPPHAEAAQHWPPAPPPPPHRPPPPGGLVPSAALQALPASTLALGHNRGAAAALPLRPLRVLPTLDPFAVARPPRLLPARHPFALPGSLRVLSARYAGSLRVLAALQPFALLRPLRVLRARTGFTCPFPLRVVGFLCHGCLQFRQSPVASSRVSPGHTSGEAPVAIWVPTAAGLPPQPHATEDVRSFFWRRSRGQPTPSPRRVGGFRRRHSPPVPLSPKACSPPLGARPVLWWFPRHPTSPDLAVPASRRAPGHRYAPRTRPVIWRRQPSC